MREMTCIVCPKGCRLAVEKMDGEISVKGALCPRGDKYAIQELTDPQRSLQTTVRTTLAGCRRAAVKLSSEIPLKEIFLYMEEINKVVLTEKKHVGEVVAANLRGSGIDLILTERLY